jgi:Zn-dependent protease
VQIRHTDFSGTIFGMGNVSPNLFPFAAQITSVRHSYVIIQNKLSIFNSQFLILSMLNYLFTNPLYFFLWVAALLAAITVHEFAHAWTSDRLGDPTARLAGRVTLNPLAHLDPLGTLMLLFFRFGWGKPVPFDPFNLRHPRRDTALISFAGPAADFILAIILALIIRLTHTIAPPQTAYTLELLLTPFITLALILAIFNLIPIHPLDGGKVLIGLLPERLAYKWDEFLNQFGFFIIIFLLMPFFAGYSLVNLLISPLVNFFLYLLLPGTPLI